ncbi:MAG: hypothetical protein KF795_30800 [Labilithrix sp.]|nr:hypothetical protein [Labilithrix sp.]
MASVRKESDAKTLVERGKGFAAVGDHTRAEEYLASGIEAGADPRDVLPLLMDVCVRTGRYRSAIQHGENHLRKHPHDLRTRVMVGALYAAINESKQARSQLEPVVKADDEADDAGAPSPLRAELQAQAHYLLAVVARDGDNDVVAADRHFREYLRIEPRGAHAEEAKAALLKRVEPEIKREAPPEAPPEVQPEGGAP